MSQLRSRVVAALAAAMCTLHASSAAADEPNVCKDAYEQSQVFMKPKSGAEESSLLRARASLLTCMRSSCKDWMVADCSKWLTEVEARIPTVVFAARNTAGRDLGDVQVLGPSGEVLAARLDGRANEIEPGDHVFVFVAADGTRVEKRALVREGEKAQSIVATFQASAEELAQAHAQGGGQGDTTGPRTEKRKSDLVYVGYGAAGLGVVGLGVGSIFGITAITKKNAAHCDDTGACDDGAALDDAHSAATVATVGFVAGAALLAAGVALVLFSPTTTVRIEARASTLPGGGLAGVGGVW